MSGWAYWTSPLLQMLNIRHNARVNRCAPHAAHSTGILQFFPWVLPEEAEEQQQAMVEVEREEGRELAEAAHCCALLALKLCCQSKGESNG
jgi:hypothetical protein